MIVQADWFYWHCFLRYAFLFMVLLSRWCHQHMDASVCKYPSKVMHPSSLYITLNVKTSNNRQYMRQKGLSNIQKYPLDMAFCIKYSGFLQHWLFCLQKIHFGQSGFTVIYMFTRLKYRRLSGGTHFFCRVHNQLIITLSNFHII